MTVPLSGSEPAGMAAANEKRPAERSGRFKSNSQPRETQYWNAARRDNRQMDTLRPEYKGRGRDCRTLARYRTSRTPAGRRGPTRNGDEALPPTHPTLNFSITAMSGSNPSPGLSGMATSLAVGRGRSRPTSASGRM